MSNARMSVEEADNLKKGEKVGIFKNFTWWVGGPFIRIVELPRNVNVNIFFISQLLSDRKISSSFSFPDCRVPL